MASTRRPSAGPSSTPGAPVVVAPPGEPGPGDPAHGDPAHGDPGERGEPAHRGSVPGESGVRAGRDPVEWLLGTSRGNGIAAFVLYLVASVFIFGIPILAHPTGTFVGWGADPPSFVWYLGWWPHAIWHGLDPVVTHHVWAPVGVNLTHATAIPGPSLALAPVTILFGPVVSYNVMALLTPVLAAWTAYLLCRAVTGQFWASLVGGYLFGFSVYVTGQMLGHPNLALVFLLPVLALLALRLVRGARSLRRTVLWMAAALVGQFLTSYEVFLSLTMFVAIALLLALAMLPSHRRPLRDVAVAVGASYALTAVVVSPLLWSFLMAKESPPTYAFWSTIFATDLVNFLVPTSLTAAGGGNFFDVTGKFTGDISEQAAYFGLPVLLMVAAFTIACWRHRWAKWMLAFTGVACVLSLGTHLHIAGTETIPMPWKALVSLPLLKYALPGRFMVYAWLPVAVMAAMWLALRPSGLGRWMLAALAVVMLYPNTHGPFWHTSFSEPAFFADGSVSREIPHDATVLVIPFALNGDSMLWQADSGFWFRMPTGYVGTRKPLAFGNWPIEDVLYSGQPGADSAEQLKQYLGANHVSAVVVVKGTPGAWARLFAPLGQPRSVQDVDIYTVPGSILRGYADSPRPPG